MIMKKKVFAIVLCVAMLAVAIAGGTLAYFTDTEAVDNVFTLGNVDIDLIESFYHRKGAVMDNVPDAYKLPAGAEINDATIENSEQWYEDYLKSVKLLPDTGFNKCPYVKNTGASDAYVRIRVMIPKNLDQDYLYNSMYCSSALDSEFTKTHFGEESITGYAVYEFTRVEPLAPGEMTYWNVWNTIHMDPEVTNQDIELLGGIDLKMSVRVEADAIQADSFDNATEAWAAFDAQTSNHVNTADGYSADGKDGFMGTNDVE